MSIASHLRSYSSDGRFVLLLPYRNTLSRPRGWICESIAKIFKEGKGLRVKTTEMATTRSASFSVTGIPVISQFVQKEKRHFWYSHFAMSIRLPGAGTEEDDEDDADREDGKAGGDEANGAASAADAAAGDGAGQVGNEVFSFDEDLFSQMDPLSEVQADFKQPASISGGDYQVSIFARKRTNTGMMVQATQVDSGSILTLLLPDRRGLPKFVRGSKRDAFYQGIVKALRVLPVPDMGEGRFLIWTEVPPGKPKPT